MKKWFTSTLLIIEKLIKMENFGKKELKKMQIFGFQKDFFKST
jgi:hypothetical protein